jgi:hypothetical protein
MTTSPREGGCDGRRFSPLETGVQPRQASPCVQDLRNGSASILSGPSALPTGSFPDRGFPSRLAGCPKAGAYALDLLPLWGNLMCAEAAHHTFRDGIQKTPYTIILPTMRRRLSYIVRVFVGFSFFSIELTVPSPFKSPAPGGDDWTLVSLLLCVSVASQRFLRSAKQRLSGSSGRVTQVFALGPIP